MWRLIIGETGLRKAGIKDARRLSSKRAILSCSNYAEAVALADAFSHTFAFLKSPSIAIPNLKWVAYQVALGTLVIGLTIFVATNPESVQVVIPTMAKLLPATF